MKTTTRDSVVGFTTRVEIDFWKLLAILAVGAVVGWGFGWMEGHSIGYGEGLDQGTAIWRDGR